MSLLNRRQALKALLGGALQTAGTVVVASWVLPAGDARAEAPEAGQDVQQRADHLAANRREQQPEPPAGAQISGFRNAGAFSNGGFNNGGGGAFRNGGFANGGFSNAGFRNGGFANGAFRNGAFRN
jgi:rSAM-associated Gly-rich repeat protein